jgi:photosystem II stability/assembly factor-like uncharacterized protein
MIVMRKSLVAALAVLAVCGTATPSFAENSWERNHPRRDQVNDRIANQSHRISQERREGELTRGQAHYLRQQDRHILGQERRDARWNGGYITRGEQAHFNHELNTVSREIGR